MLTRGQIASALMTFAETTTRIIKNNRGLDPFLLTGIALILAFGIVMVTSASYIIAAGKFGDGFYYAKKQGLAMVVGLGIMYLFSFINPQFWKLAAYPLLGIGILLLGMVFVPGIGIEMGGSASMASVAVRILFSAFRISQVCFDQFFCLVSG